MSAATRVLAFAMIATAKEFRKSWRPRLRRLGVTSLSAVPALADGASWIWKAMDRVLTGCIQTLDFYHGCQHISKCAEGIFGEGTTEKRGRGRLITTRESGYTLPEPAVFDSTCVPRPLSL